MRMLIYPDIDPIAFQIGPLAVHWYGLMYLVGFVGGWWLCVRRAERVGWSRAQIDDLVFYAAMGVVVGGRLGYTLFYNLDHFLHNPIILFQIWKGGMSFHGGLIGVLIAMGLFARKVGAGFFQVTDFIAPVVPIGLGAGRIGNFINGELWGKPTDAAWGVLVPGHGPLAVHASQLYEAAREGVVLFVILWWFSHKPRPVGQVSALFLIGYGGFRFLIEFVRLPDAHLGYLAFGWLTMGQVLTLPMLLFGIFLYIHSTARGAAS